VKPEEIKKILESLNPAIEAITDSGVKTIINTLLAIITAQQKEIEALKEKLNTNSDNSSMPPSGDRFKPSKPQKKKNKRNRGGQPGHTGTTRQLLPETEVDQIEQHQPPAHCECGGDIQTPHCYQRHQVHELPPVKIVVTEHQLFTGCCNQCGKEHRAALPSHVPSGMLGPCLLALIAALTSDYKMSKRDVSRLFTDLFSLSLSIATVKRAEETMSGAIAIPVEEAKAYVKKQSFVNTDETSHAECGKKMWTWVAVSKAVAVFMIVASRSAQSAKTLLGETFKGILGSDRYSAYNWVVAACRQACWAHLIRDFKKIAERPGKSKWIGLRLLVYTQRMFHTWHQVRDSVLTHEEFKEAMEPIRSKVEALLRAGTRAEHSKTQGTCFEILKIKEALWTFIDTVGVEPTNNLAERVLRKVVIWRKMCFGTWSANGTLYLERVMTVVATCRLQNRSTFAFLRDAIQAQLNNQTPPSLLPI